jgi:hypothetical protein
MLSTQQIRITKNSQRIDNLINSMLSRKKETTARGQVTTRVTLLEDLLEEHQEQSRLLVPRISSSSKLSSK